MRPLQTDSPNEGGSDAPRPVPTGAGKYARLHSHTVGAALIPKAIYETLTYPKGFMSVLPSKSGEGRLAERHERRREVRGVKSLFYFRVARPEPLRGGRPHLRKE